MVFKTCGPNEALVISGCCYSKPEILIGGRKFIFMCVQKAQKLSLNTMTLKIESPRIYTKLGVPLTVTGVAQVKIQSANRDLLETACEAFLGRSEHDIGEIAKATLEGHQRAIIGNMTVEEIYLDRTKFNKQVFDVASTDLMTLGFSVVSYTIKDLHDDEGYLKALGMTRTAQVKKDGRIGEAEATSESGIKMATSEQVQKSAEYENQIKVAEAQRDFAVKNAEYQRQVNGKKAESTLAYSLQVAKTKQQIRFEEKSVELVEKTRTIEVVDLEIVRKERELESRIKKPAEAERYRLATIAEAEKQAEIKNAQAEAEMIRLRGEANAFSIQAKAQAEAEQMVKKAEALSQYQQAAKLDMVIKSLPKIAAEVAAPLCNVNSIKMVSCGDDASMGAEKLTKEVIQIMKSMPEIVYEMTGVDIKKEMMVK